MADECYICECSDSSYVATGVILDNSHPYYFDRELEFKRLKKQENEFKSISGISIEETIECMKKGYRIALVNNNSPILKENKA